MEQGPCEQQEEPMGIMMGMISSKLHENSHRRRNLYIMDTRMDFFLLLDLFGFLHKGKKTPSTKLSHVKDH
jgi:hypothetical protein